MIIGVAAVDEDGKIFLPGNEPVKYIKPYITAAPIANVSNMVAVEPPLMSFVFNIVIIFALDITPFYPKSLTEIKKAVLPPILQPQLQLNCIFRRICILVFDAFRYFKPQLQIHGN